MINCCVDCALRNIDCHSKCEEYLRQRAEHEEERAALQAIREREGTMYLYTRDTKYKGKRRQNRVKGR